MPPAKRINSATQAYMNSIHALLHVLSIQLHHEANNLQLVQARTVSEEAAAKLAATRDELDSTKVGLKKAEEELKHKCRKFLLYSLWKLTKGASYEWMKEAIYSAKATYRTEYRMNIRVND